MKKALLTLGSLVFAALTFIFFALPTVQSFVEANGEKKTIGDPASAFDIFDGGQDFFKAMLIMTAIFACLVVIFAIVKMLTDSKVVKSKSASKIVNFIFAVSVIGLLVCAILYMISVIVFCNDYSGSTDDTFLGDIIDFSAGGGLGPVYWNIILVPIFALFSTGLGLYSLSKKK